MSVFSERFIDQHPLPPMLYLHDGLYEIGQHEIVVQVSFFKKNDLKLNLYQAKLFKIYKSISIDLDPNLGDIDVSVSIDLQNNETYNLSVKKNSHDL
jgi:hypothetical protein